MSFIDLSSSLSEHHPILTQCVFVSTYATIEELVDKLKGVSAPAKSVYQLQGESGNTLMWERENVLSHANRIKEIADRIEDTHRLNNGG